MAGPSLQSEILSPSFLKLDILPCAALPMHVSMQEECVSQGMVQAKSKQGQVKRIPFTWQLPKGDHDGRPDLLNWYSGSMSILETVADELERNLHSRRAA